MFIWEESKDKEERKSAAGLTSLDQSNNNKFGRWGSLRSSAVFGLFDLLRGGGHLGSLLEPSNRGKKQPGATLSGQWTLGNEEKMWGQQRRHDQVLGENLCERERGHPRMRTEHRERGRDPIPSFSPLWHYSRSFSEKIARHAIASLIIQA